MAGNLYFAWENTANTLRNMRDFILEKNDKRLILYGVISTQKQRYNATLKRNYMYGMVFFNNMQSFNNIEQAIL
jgi:hypothetical protein